MGVTVKLENVSKQFKTPNGGITTAVDNLSLTVSGGSFVTLLGPSGCGKTTTLRMIAGFEVPDSGRIAIDGVDVTYIPPNQRGLAMVFQSYALFPHLTVAGNIGYGLKIRKIPPAKYRERVESALKLVGLEGLGERYTNQLSGGQQQRVALARAVVLNPKVLLFDEPLSNLDAKLREEMRYRLRDLQQQLQTTSIYVTHDQVEAMTMSDIIVVINKGRIEQTGPPAEIYEHPASRFVAEFIGRVNLLEAKLLKKQIDGLEINVLGQTVKLNSFSNSSSQMYVAARPESIEFQPEGAWNGPVFSGRLIKAVYVGQHVEYLVKLDAGPELTVITLGRRPDLRLGEPLRVGLKVATLHGLPA